MHNPYESLVLLFQHDFSILIIHSAYQILPDVAGSDLPIGFYHQLLYYKLLTLYAERV